jgi:hypothetical protein
MLGKKLVIRYLEFEFRLMNQIMKQEIDVALLTEYNELKGKRGLAASLGLLAPRSG